MSTDEGLVGTHGLEPAAPGAKVTRLELFYDLVFVFAFLNVTTVSAKYLSPSALSRSLLVLALLWYVWTSFATLGNAIRTDQGIMPLFGFGIMAAIFLASVALPEAFIDIPTGLPGDLTFAACYLLALGLQVLAFWYAVRGDPQLHRWWRRLAVPPLVTTALLLVAALVPRQLFRGDAEIRARLGLWALAVAVAYLLGALTRRPGLTIVSAGHWAERHAQIVLVALGESILSLGTGPNLLAGLPLTWPIIGGAVLGIAVVAALWWVYFDARVIAGEQALHRAHGAARLALARDAYSYLHLPMIFGIILFSLGLKHVLALIADPTVPWDRDLLGGIDLAVLYGGVLLFLLAVLGLQIRTVHQFRWFQIGALLVLAALIPVAGQLSAFGALVLLAVAVVGAATVDSLRNRQPRQRLRRAKLEEERALEVRETEWRRREHLRRPPET
ncbi:low temperature requirement protein A [Micromonospora sp. NPDC047548]|uniref:low temperature requirement protein A n=1 Tax=Micromonospora sp. NPDC047548 TaxID=3155624 RepID=UPI0033D2E3E1